MTQRKFDLEAGLALLADKFNQYPYRNVANSEGKHTWVVSDGSIRDTMRSGTPRATGYDTLEEAAKAALRDLRTQLKDVMFKSQGDIDRYQGNLTEIASVGNIGKDD